MCLPHSSRVFCFLVSAALATPALRATEPAVLAVDTASSKIEIAVKVTVDSFVGRLDAYQANIAVDPASHAVTHATLDFRWADVKTGKAERDKQMNEWQHSDEFPTGQFTLVNLAPANAAGSQQASGTLALHGHTHDVTFPVTIRMNGNVETIDGDAPVDVRDYGLPVIRKFGLLKVDPVVHVRFHVQGALPAAS